MLLDENNLPDKEPVVNRVKSDILQYGMATFTRALPSSFDGLKPIHRRIIYTMWKNRVTGSIKVSKLAGLVIAYHPHGDASISDAIVKMAQQPTNNHSILSPEGSFGNISDLSAASPRYISTKMSDFGNDVIYSLIDAHTLEMIESEADFGEKEPLFLPSKIPVCLINGSMGIAESFTSDIPQHNLSDIADRAIMYIKNKDVSVYRLAKGLYPDYVVGGTIINGDDIPPYYTGDGEGGGLVKVRGDSEIDMQNNMIIIRSIPISFDFDSFTNKVKSLINEKDKSGNPKNLVLANISYIGEAKDKGTKEPYIFINCKNGANLVEVLENLYKYTHLEYSNKINLTFNYEGRVKKCTIKDVLKDWYEANYMLRRRKIIYNINTLENRVHILEGLVKVYPNIDGVINIIKSSNDTKDAVILKLKNKFGLTLIQARGIYEMQLGNLTKRSKGELENTIKRVKENIKNLSRDLTRIDDIMISDLLEIKKKYGRERRTKIVSKLEESTDIVISNGVILSSRNNIGIFDSSNIISGRKILNGFRGVKINGKWVKEIIGSHRIDDDISSVAVFYENGMMNAIIPTMINSWVNNQYCQDNGFIKSVCPIYKNIGGFVVCITNDGMLKRFRLQGLSNRTVKISTIVENSIFVADEYEDSNLLLVNSEGEYIYIKISDIPLTNRGSKGVKSSFNSGIGVRMTVDGKNNSHFVILMENIKLGAGFTYTRQIDEFKVMGRTNKPKRIYKFPDYKCLGVGTVDLSLQNQIGLFISESSTIGLKITNLRNLKSPRKISCKAFDFIPIEIV